MTHLPNELALKMDGAQAYYLYSAVKSLSSSCCDDLTSRRAWRLCRSIGVNQCGTASSADLGGSSKYSNENFED
jgi:hypothetical protein